MFRPAWCATPTGARARGDLPRPVPHLHQPAGGFLGGERISYVLIRHLPPPRSCVVGGGLRSRCALRPPGYPHRTGDEGSSRPEDKGIVVPGRLTGGTPGCVLSGGSRTRSGWVE